MKKSFIPKNKPKSWVVFALTGLAGIGLGICAFTAAYFGWPLVKLIFVVLFLACWFVAALAAFRCTVGSLMGEYRNLSEKPWREQVW